MSLQTGDIAYLRYGSDNKWHWGFFSPVASTLVGFDADALTQFKAISSMAAAVTRVFGNSPARTIQTQVDATTQIFLGEIANLHRMNAVSNRRTK